MGKDSKNIVTRINGKKAYVPTMPEGTFDEMVTNTTPEPSIKWSPEDFNFDSPKNKVVPGLWYYKNFELRSLANDYWLLRRKTKNNNGNTEMLVKWYLYIPLDDKELAEIFLTKGLK